MRLESTVPVEVRIERSDRGQRQPAIVLRARHIRRETVRPDIHLVEVEGTVGAHDVVAHVAGFEQRALEFMLDSD